ncbi:DNA/RNA non-specific endonuclease [Neolewinella aurantiaca]|uniref:DNA/RNA non-specific endonuclease n=1 Tax=Neolewinella aurantiaca TaxID=2602767 RepID=A0A5C7FHW4_9BACT|nr:DNA/RNA non-specific endonuclease [Neolewinella aurantiaca]TXF89333.1 DNA/RNA non-specific endonuclease [Neolewinella aurantiaca]
MKKRLPMLIKFRLLLVLVLGSFVANGQTIDVQLAGKEDERRLIFQQLDQLDKEIESLKFEQIRGDLRSVGLPAGEQVWHSAMVLSYAEEHEQARWVAHIIRPEVTDGTGARTNDFRADPLVSTGSAVEEDYFLKYLQADSTYKYDGFGWDRGHLAPSADFRWSETATSESYFYSNMSPQVGDFNREGWAKLEGLLRGHVDRSGRQLIVVTGGVLQEGLPVVERGVNKVSVPEQFYKVVLDVEAGKAIGFLMPNAKLRYPIEHYAVSVDEVEDLTGLDFFGLVGAEEQVEADADTEFWIPEVAAGDVEPIYAPSLPRGHFNTVQAKLYMGRGKKVTVVGKVVSSRYSQAGHLWFNLDKQYPNQIFSVMIRKENLVNFPGDPKAEFDGKVIAVTGEVSEIGGSPVMFVDGEEGVSEFY